VKSALPFFGITFLMAKSIAVLPKKRGRPATGRDPVMSIRLSPDLRARVDAWASRQEDKLSSSEAIRRLIELGLAKAPTTRNKGAGYAEKAAGALKGTKYPEHVKAERKRRLTKSSR
jgi:predicted transcriptional regulator